MHLPKDSSGAAPAALAAACAARASTSALRIAALATGSDDRAMTIRGYRWIFEGRFLGCSRPYRRTCPENLQFFRRREGTTAWNLFLFSNPLVSERHLTPTWSIPSDLHTASSARTPWPRSSENSNKMPLLSQILPSRLFTRTIKDGVAKPEAYTMSSPTKKRKATAEAEDDPDEAIFPEPVTPDQTKEGTLRSKRVRRAQRELSLSDLPDDLLRAALSSLDTSSDLTAAGQVWPAEVEVRPETLAELRSRPVARLIAARLETPAECTVRHYLSRHRVRFGTCGLSVFAHEIWGMHADCDQSRSDTAPRWIACVADS